MTNATKTLALFFAGTLALALATSWSWSTGSSAAFQSNLLAVDTSAVQAVRVERSDGPSVRLERSDGRWSVSPGDTEASYPASAQAVDALFRTLPNLSVGAVTTRQTDNHPRYGVDSTGTQITMLGSGGETLGELILGRTRVRQPESGGPGQSPRQRLRRRRRGTPVTYVRQPSRPDVYSVEQSFRSLVTRSVEDWRKKQIWAVDRSKVRRVDVTVPGGDSYTMQRAAPSDTASAAAPDTWLSAGDTLKTAEVSSMLRTLSSPTADGFVEGMSPEDVDDARHRVQLQLADGSRRILQLRPGSSGVYYEAVADSFPYVVQLNKQTWDDDVLRARSVLLKNE